MAKKRGAPYCNRNAVGNKGGGAPLVSLNAEKTGFSTDIMYRSQMAEIERRLIEKGDYSIEVVRYFAKKVKSGQIKVNIFNR